MKEIRLQDLLNLADAAAHDSIGDLWNQKAIHFLVVFTSPDQDFELIGVGPTLPYATLEAAETHQIPNKKPEFYVKCPATIAGRLQPKLAPIPARSTRPPQATTPVPSLKGRTAAPFLRPALKMPAKAASGEPETGKAETVSPPMPAVEPVPALTPVPASVVQSTPAPTLEERERALAKREQELATLAASLKIREAALHEREAALAASEEKLLNPPQKTN